MSLGENSNQSLKKLTLWQRVAALCTLHSSPHEISLGVAIGVFIAILPVYGLHTVMVVVAALVIKRVNKISILLGTNISTIFTFPFITWAGYSIGRFMLPGHNPALRWDTFKHFNYPKILEIYFPLFAGSVVLAIFLALLFYAITFFFVSMKRVKSHEELA